MEPLAAVTRNDYVESIHSGYVCVVDSTGKVLYSLGDYHTRIFFRSSAKPIQVLPFLYSGAADAFGFTHEEIALACASHAGQPIHQGAALGMLRKLHLNENALHCGTMSPYNEKENDRLIANGESPSVLHASCSGKHAAMLALAKYKGYPLFNYEDPSNPVQQKILETIAEFAEEDMDSIPVGTDGCGVPIYLLPIHKIALSYAKISDYAQDESSQYHTACQIVFQAMNLYPEMVAGDQEFDTELMRTTRGKLISKVGSEAVYCLSIHKQKLGICIKIADGNERAVYPTVLQVLLDLGVLNESEFNALRHWYQPVLKNNLDEEIGKITPIFSLNSIQQKIQLGTELNLL